MPATLFEFFEVISEELSLEESRIITPDSLRDKDRGSSLLDDLKREARSNSTETAIQLAVDGLQRHFEGKGSILPFQYEPSTGRFTATDREFLKFVRDMSSIRSRGKRSHDFECEVAKRLTLRATGAIHRVGDPRDRKKKKADFNAHLATLGFDRPVLLGKERDGGFDILWLLPLGTIPHRPIVSVQCKNGEFEMGEADKSLGSGSRSFSRHGGLQPSVHVPCVLFNDYISEEDLTRKQLNFVPLGLTDLAAIDPPITIELI